MIILLLNFFSLRLHLVDIVSNTSQMFQSNMSHILLLLSLEMWSPPTWGKGKKKKKIWRNYILLTHWKKKWFPPVIMTERRQNRNHKIHKHTQNFTEKLASILKGWSSLNNNKKMKRFSTSYTGFSSLWSWRSRKDFNIYLRGMGRTYIGENEGEGKDKGASFSWFSLLERFSLFVFMGGWVWLVVVTFTLKMIRTLRIVILCKASYIFYNNNFFFVKWNCTTPDHTRARVRDGAMAYIKESHNFLKNYRSCIIAFFFWGVSNSKNRTLKKYSNFNVALAIVKSITHKQLRVLTLQCYPLFLL